MKAIQMSTELRLLVQMVQQELLHANPTFDLQGINWDKFKKFCAYHGMRHVAFSADQKQKTLPDNLSNQYKQFAHIRAKSNLDNVIEIKRLYALFEKEDIHPILLKGALYTQLLYQNKLLRESTDIDFLFKKGDSLKGMLILLDQNYTCRDLGVLDRSIDLKKDFNHLIFESTMQELHFDKKPFNLDFHWDLYHQFFYYQFDPNFLFEDQKEIDFYGQKVSITNPNALFWSLVFHHGGKEFWLKFKDLVDLLAYMETYKNQVDWEMIILQAKKFKIWTVVKNGFWYLQEIFEYELPFVLARELNGYTPKKMNLVIDFWEKASYWNKMSARWDYEKILHHSQDEGYTFFSYLKKLYITYNTPNPFERKRIFNFPPGLGVLNFMDKVISYVVYHLFRKK